MRYFTKNIMYRTSRAIFHMLLLHIGESSIWLLIGSFIRYFQIDCLGSNLIIKKKLPSNENIGKEWIIWFLRGLFSGYIEEYSESYFFWVIVRFDYKNYYFGLSKYLFLVKIEIYLLKGLFSEDPRVYIRSFFSVRSRLHY